jgi:hypothetical protein
MENFNQTIVDAIANEVNTNVNVLHSGVVVTHGWARVGTRGYGYPQKFHNPDPHPPGQQPRVPARNLQVPGYPLMDGYLWVLMRVPVLRVYYGREVGE